MPPRPATRPAVRPVPLDLADPAVLGEVLRLQRVAYAVEAALIGDDRIPPLHESAEQLQDAGLSWLGVPIADVLAADAAPTEADAARAAGGRSPGLAAAVAWVVEDGLLDLHRLVVDPASARRGLGRALVLHLLAAYPGLRVTVSTGRDNLPARRLYAGLGFEEAGTVEVLPGLEVTRYVLER